MRVERWREGEALEKRREECRRYREKNKLKVRAYMREYMRRHPHYNAASYRRRKAKSAEERQADLRWWRFRLRPDAFAALLTAQENRCAICRSPDPKRGSWCVDHDHSTAAVRGLLCFKCNSALGMFGDSVESLEAAVAYLRNPPALPVLEKLHQPKQAALALVKARS